MSARSKDRPRVSRSLLSVPGGSLTPGPSTIVVLAAALAVVARLPFLLLPPSSDEAGLLAVAGQWHHGSSLYGNYWVDRPPGLMSILAVTDLVGGLLPLRLVGAACAACCVLLAGRLGRLVAPQRPHSAATAAVLVAALTSSPLLDVTVVDSEILALPFVLAGLVALLHAVEEPRAAPSRLRWAVAAGAAGAMALSTKQNFAEVLLVAVFLALVLAWRGERRNAAMLAGSVAAGALAVVAALLAVSAWRGTDLGGLWASVIEFRAHASSVIADEATRATLDRARRLALAFVVTGAPLIVLLIVRLPWRMPRAPNDEAERWDGVLTWICVLLVVIEAGSIAAGGSYWLHYLVQVVPALAVIAAHASGRDRLPRRLAGVVLAVVVSSAAVAWVTEVVHPRTLPNDDVAVIDYLRDNADRGRTLVVAYGDSAILTGAGMSSPYENLWSLPVRVRDPHLRELTHVLAGPRAPSWVVVTGSSLASWGIDAHHADRVLHRRYRVVMTNATFHVFSLRQGS